MRVPYAFLFLSATALSVSSLHAATLCVSSDGSYPCYARISDAVAAAAPGDVIRVGPGTYFDSVNITKPLSLVTENAVIDATGRDRGVYVNGLNSPGLREVNLAGFTVRNAQFEGILVINTTAATISGNAVLNNNQAVQSGTCPGLDQFESDEQVDCGSGIHLLGADHSVVTNNIVQGNAGGILVSDDTGRAHDNVLSFNTVNNNGYASGITLASFAASLMTQKVGPAHGAAKAAQGVDDVDSDQDEISFGVFHNTVYGNRSRSNGLLNGGGAGVNVVASAGSGQVYSNVVVANLLTENALPGVTLHAATSGQLMNDNLVLGNTVVSNGSDRADAATPGPTGINLYSVSMATGNMVIGNQVQNEAFDVAVQVPAPVQIQFNSLQGNGAGVANLGVGTIAAEQNFWSCPNGPTIQGSCSTVFGSDVSWAPWLQMPAPVMPNF